MYVRKSPETVEELRKEASEITQGLRGLPGASGSDIATVLDLIEEAEKHLDETRPGYYPTDEEHVHLDLAAAFAALAKAGARAVAFRLDRADPPDKSSS
jgi:hypothetical protein